MQRVADAGKLLGVLSRALAAQEEQVGDGDARKRRQRRQPQESPFAGQTAVGDLGLRQGAV